MSEYKEVVLGNGGIVYKSEDGEVVYRLPDLDFSKFEPIGWSWNGEFHLFKAKGSKMHQQIESVHTNDANGNPAGGWARGRGIEIVWQDGPLAVDGERKEPNGAFVEGVIEAALDRIRYYNEGKFRCRENSLAITKLEEALQWLDWRTRDREERGVEGTHEL